MAGFWTKNKFWSSQATILELWASPELLGPLGTLLGELLQPTGHETTISPGTEFPQIVKNRKYQSEQYFSNKRQNNKVFLRKNQYQSFV